MSLLIGVTLLLSSLTATPREAPPRYGWAKHYYPGLMQRVYDVRVRQGLIRRGTPRGDGLASTVDCHNIGKRARVRLWDPEKRRWGPLLSLLVVDCSAPRDAARHIRQGLLVEVNYALAEQFNWEWDGRRGHGKTRVQFYGVR